VSFFYDNQSEASYLQKANRVAVICHAISLLIFGVIGFFHFTGDMTMENSWQPIAYYILLCLPALLGFCIYTVEKDAVYLRHMVFISAAIFYYFLLIFGMEQLHLPYAVVVMGITVIYMRRIFTFWVSLVAMLINVLAIIASASYENSVHMQLEQRIIETALVGGMGILIILFSSIIEENQNKKNDAIDFETEKFEALVSVGIRRIFEYDLKTDKFMTARSTNGQYGFRRIIENFSTVAKTYRFVLYADWPIFEEFVEMCQRGDELISIQMRLRDRNADYRWYEIRGKSIYDEKGTPYKVIGVLENIDEKKRNELRHVDENKRDSLTRLYRSNFAKELTDEFLAQQDGSEYGGMLLLDVDNFKFINEEMGKTFGDEILKNIAYDLDAIFYPTDVLGRSGIDEFVIFMKNIKAVEDIEKKILEIQETLGKIYLGEQLDIKSTVSIGASVYPNDGITYDELRDRAEKALFHAKTNGKNTYSFYREDMENVYTEHGLEERYKKMKEEEEAQRLLTEKTSGSLVELAFKLIDESKDTDSAINLLIRQVCREMNLDGVCIRTRKGQEKSICCPYTYSTDEHFQYSDAEFTFTDKEWKEMLQSFAENDGFHYINDVTTLTDDTNRKVALAYGIHSFARCAYYDKGEYAGNIDLFTLNEAHAWKKEELMTLRAVTNLVFSYLMKMKAYEEARETVERLTGYDSVTGFYKYEKFLNFVEDYVYKAPHGRYAMIYTDFSNFKYINETYDYETGDQVLHDFAKMASTYSKRFICGSRVFSDNMVILLTLGEHTDEEMVDELNHFAELFRDKISTEYLGSNIELDVGICTFTIDGKEVPIKEIVSNANLARKESKLPNSPRCILYNADMGDNLKKENFYVNEMEDGFKNNEFVVYLQPKVDLNKREITAAEALIRWKRLDGTFIYPNEFIPVFEKNKVIARVDYFVYEQVCQYLERRIRSGEKPISISMNVSRMHLNNVKGFVDYIKGLLEKYQVPAELLEFELTESLYTDKVDNTILMMKELRSLGVKVSMDDFGSGYSSLNILTKLPLHVLKLDKEFLRDFEKDSQEKIIIPSIIDMAKKLSLDVVCEGVETKEQVEFLRSVGCDYAQGYFYSKPIPMEEFSSIMKNPYFIVGKDNA